MDFMHIGEEEKLLGVIQFRACPIQVDVQADILGLCVHV